MKIDTASISEVQHHSGDLQELTTPFSSHVDLQVIPLPAPPLSRDSELGSSSRTNRNRLLSRSSDAEVCRREFLTTYRVRLLGDSQIELNVSSHAPLSLLNDAQRISLMLYKQCHTYPLTLSDMATLREFRKRMPPASRLLRIDGNVANSTNMTRDEHTARGFNTPSIRDLALAHAAYFILTGRDLFGGNVVRACDGSLFFNAHGLSVFRFIDDGRRTRVAASSNLLASVPTQSTRAG